MTADYLTDGEVETLNAARTILTRLRQDAQSATYGIESKGDAYSFGYFAAHAENAEHAIFETLNVGRAHLGMLLSDAQVHNREESAA